MTAIVVTSATHRALSAPRCRRNNVKLLI